MERESKERDTYLKFLKLNIMRCDPDKIARVYGVERHEHVAVDLYTYMSNEGD